MGSDPKEWWPDTPDDEAEIEEPLAPAPKTCRHCGVTDLHWMQVGDKWRLFGPNHRQHVCPVKPLPQAKAAP